MADRLERDDVWAASGLSASASVGLLLLGKGDRRTDTLERDESCEWTAALLAERERESRG